MFFCVICGKIFYHLVPTEQLLKSVLTSILWRKTLCRIERQRDDLADCSYRWSDHTCPLSVSQRMERLLESVDSSLQSFTSIGTCQSWRGYLRVFSCPSAACQQETLTVELISSDSTDVLHKQRDFSTVTASTYESLHIKHNVAVRELVSTTANTSKKQRASS